MQGTAEPQGTDGDWRTIGLLSDAPLDQLDTDDAARCDPLVEQLVRQLGGFLRARYDGPGPNLQAPESVYSVVWVRARPRSSGVRYAGFEVHQATGSGKSGPNCSTPLITRTRTWNSSWTGCWVGLRLQPVIV